MTSSISQSTNTISNSKFTIPKFDSTTTSKSQSGRNGNVSKSDSNQPKSFTRDGDSESNSSSINHVLSKDDISISSTLKHKSQQILSKSSSVSKLSKWFKESPLLSTNPLSKISTPSSQTLLRLPATVISTLDGHTYSYPQIEQDPKRSIYGTISFWFHECLTLAHLTYVLIKHLSLYQRWILMLFRLMLFAMFLIPAWIRVGRTYIYDKRILKSIKYGNANRNYLDLYLPSENSNNDLLTIHSKLNESDMPAFDHPRTSPVVVYFTGGAWIIGYKAWGALLALALRQFGVIVVSVDYRNYPQTNIRGMCNDGELALQWVYNNIGLYGGDTNQMWLVGQSAGAHIASLLVLRNAKREALGQLGGKVMETTNQMTSPLKNPNQQAQRSSSRINHQHSNDVPQLDAAPEFDSSRFDIDDIDVKLSPSLPSLRHSRTTSNASQSPHHKHVQSLTPIIQPSSLSQRQSQTDSIQRRSSLISALSDEISSNELDAHIDFDCSHDPLLAAHSTQLANSSPENRIRILEKYQRLLQMKEDILRGQTVPNSPDNKNPNVNRNDFISSSSSEAEKSRPSSHAEQLLQILEQKAKLQAQLVSQQQLMMRTCSENTILKVVSPNSDLSVDSNTIDELNEYPSLTLPQSASPFKRNNTIATTESYHTPTIPTSILNSMKQSNHTFPSSLHHVCDEGNGNQLGFAVSKLRGFIGISGVYNMVLSCEHLTRRGLPRGIIYNIMQSARNLGNWSPTLVAQSEWFQSNSDKVKQFIPPVLLIHGHSDHSMPCRVSQEFSSALESMGANVTTRYYNNCTHTDPIIEGPLLGVDFLQHDLLQVIYSTHKYKEVCQQQQNIINPNRQPKNDGINGSKIMTNFEDLNWQKASNGISCDVTKPSNHSKTTMSTNNRLSESLSKTGSDQCLNGKPKLRHRIPLIRSLFGLFKFATTLPSATQQETTIFNDRNDSSENITIVSLPDGYRSKPLINPFLVKCARIVNPF